MLFGIRFTTVPAPGAMQQEMFAIVKGDNEDDAGGKLVSKMLEQHVEVGMMTFETDLAKFTNTYSEDGWIALAFAEV